MKFNYDEIKNEALDLLDFFGSSFNLIKQIGEPIYNPDTDTTERQIERYSGIGVLSVYSAEMIGAQDSIIDVGDIKLTCIFDDETVVPTEEEDMFEMNGTEYKIFAVEKLDPTNKNAIIYRLFARKMT